jgi:hypothetical protein
MAFRQEQPGGASTMKDGGCGGGRPLHGLIKFCIFVSCVLMLSFLPVSCSGSGSRPRYRDGSPVADTGQDVQTLARERLPNNFVIAIRAERYRYQGRANSVLSTWLYDPYKRRAATGILSQLPIGGRTADEPSPLNVGVERECLSSYDLVVAFGLLRSPRDSVIAREGRTGVILRKVSIPTRFHAGGVLVYAVLHELPMDVIVRAPNGKIIAHELHTIGSHHKACRG